MIINAYYRYYINVILFYFVEIYIKRLVLLSCELSDKKYAQIGIFIKKLETNVRPDPRPRPSSGPGLPNLAIPAQPRPDYQPRSVYSYWCFKKLYHLLAHGFV